MKVSYFFSKLILGLVFMPAFMLVADCRSDQDRNERDACHRSRRIFASFCNDNDQRILGGCNVLFTTEKANSGGGIHYDCRTGEFTIEKTGFYHINYSLASIGTAGEAGSAYGFKLVRTRNCHHEVLDSVLAGGCASILHCLNKGDKISVVSRDTVILVAGSLPPRTTSFTDTACISFIRIE